MSHIMQQRKNDSEPRGGFKIWQTMKADIKLKLGFQVPIIGYCISVLGILK